MGASDMWGGESFSQETNAVAVQLVGVGPTSGNELPGGGVAQSHVSSDERLKIMAHRCRATTPVLAVAKAGFWCGDIGWPGCCHGRDESHQQTGRSRAALTDRLAKTTGARRRDSSRGFVLQLTSRDLRL